MAVRPWVPTDAQGVTVLEFDPSLLSGPPASGASVPSLTTKDGSVTASNTTTAAQPKYNPSGINGFPTLTFSGGQFLRTAAIMQGPYWAVFSVVKQSGSSNVQNVIDGDNFNVGTGARVSQYLRFDGSGNIQSIAFTPSVATATASISAGTPLLTKIVAASLPSRTVQTSVNGGTLGTATLTADPIGASALLSLGSWTTGSQQFQGEAAYWCYVRGVLSQPDYDRFVGYLAWRFGLAGNLPADHPYKAAAPTVDDGAGAVVRPRRYIGFFSAIIRPIAILKPQDVFAILAQPANATQAAINALPFSPDLLIGKDRVAAGDWAWRDSLRGLANTLASNTTAAEAAWPGYSGSNNRIEYAHKAGGKFVAAGVFTHTTGTATNIDLSAIGVIGNAVVKRRDATGEWYAWHRSLTTGTNLRLNTTAAESATGALISVSNTTLTFSASAPSGNYSYEAFAHDPSADGIVQCGSFTGAPATISLGWQPQFFMFKRTDVADSWYIYDTVRGFSSGADKFLQPNASAAEASFDFGEATATGVTVNSGGTAGTNIYLAIRAPY